MSEKHRGLGRGLSALLGEAATPVPVTPTQAETKSTDAPVGPVSMSLEQPIELLKRNPDQPRKVFSEAEIDSLAASIKEKGVLQPILVRAIAGTNEFQIIAGERRWRAAQKAGLRNVPVLVRDLDDLEVLEIGIIENVQREDLNAIEEAKAYKVLMERFGRTQDAVAQVVSKSRSHIANMLRLLNLPESVQDHVLEGRLSAGHARAIATASDPAALAELIIAKGLSVRQAEVLARQEGQGTTSKTSKPRHWDDPDTKALQQDLQDVLGLKVRLDDKGGKGELRLSYASLEQLDEVCRRLMKMS
ncbi:ParB/RepB/Spo0J family partition protein [Asticcacaulis sp. ZE23SCel15]|uniref:ParB/RepB/Spo0J family partition protein n=1 Tax=Asticcacaulis sp. ZE23SCel15 TaxID=3059027 RepID=UPI00265F3CDD|nr:ParB/RepB/Spo0J family partition protein [Asticcacaulis sp. ZE23SCel15]WKL58290.1 ParB/RepB/Spo0J family partition protein [Asticcacaulis sp. ZE23SCel15]